MFEVIVSTAVATELLTISEVKTHLAITHTDDDTYLTALVKQVREDVENFCGISIGAQTRQWLFDGKSNYEYPIPYGPILSREDIVSVKEKTDYNEYTTLVLDTDYDIDGLQSLVFVPFLSGRFKVEYDCGYTTLPHGLKRGMLEECAYRYEHRGDEMSLASGYEASGFSKGAWEYLIKYKDMRFE